MSDTPRTDGKVVWRGGRFTESVPSVNADFARELEREIGTLKKENLRLYDECIKHEGIRVFETASYLTEIDELKSKIAELEDTIRQWAVAVVSAEPLRYRTEEEHKVLEQFADKICLSLKTKPLGFKGQEK